MEQRSSAEIQIKMSLTIYTVVRLVSAIDNTGCFTACGIHYGRPQTNFPANWDVVYAQWKAQDITADEAAVKLGISKATLYRMEKRMKMAKDR